MKRLIPVVCVGGLLAVAPAAHGAVDLAGGSTQLRLDRGTAKALDSLGVRVSATGRAKARGARVRFPITGGAIEPATAVGVIRHRGGLRLSAGRRSITLKDYDVRVGRRITLSARVGRSRVTIARLTGSPRVTRSGFGTNVSGLTARLTRPAARALNATFHVRAFARGAALGQVRVAATPSQVEFAATGATGLALDPAALQAIVGLGLTPGVVAPATLAGTTVSFPITGGVAQLDLSGGTVAHSGGISLTKGATVVRLTDFEIRLGTAVQLFAALNGGAQKVAILDLSLSGVTPAVSGRSIALAGVEARLTQGAADALNAAFGVNGFAAGLLLGRATVQATGR